MSLESAMVAIVILERCIVHVHKWIADRRRATGAGLEKAYRQTGVAMSGLYELYVDIKETHGFHSIRMVSVHNSGAPLSKTYLWKGTILATWPHTIDEKARWNEHPLDPEYQTKITEPVSMGGAGLCVVRRAELIPEGSLGLQYTRLGIEQSLMFLIAKSDSEIVFASVSFSSHQLTPDQIDAVRSCGYRIANKLKG